VKAILEFNLPDDEEEWRIYNQSQDLVIALARVREDLLRVFNNPHDYPMDEKTNAELREIFESFSEFLCI
jgi:hypothetical protein